MSLGRQRVCIPWMHPDFRTANSGDCWDLGRGWLNTEEVRIQVLFLDGVHDNSGIQQSKQIELNRFPTVRSFAKQNIWLAWFVNAHTLWPCNAVSWEFIWRKQLSAWQRSTFGAIFCVLVSHCLVGFFCVVTPGRFNMVLCCRGSLHQSFWALF